MKKVHFLLLFFPALLLQSCTTSREETITTDRETIPVSILPLEKRQIDVRIQSAGTFTTDDEVFLSFKTGGIVQRVLVNEGDAVRKGQVLATLEMTEIDAAVEQARLAREKAQRDLLRARNLFADSVATREQVENAQTAFDLTERQLEAARFNGRFSTVRANADGYVLKKLVNEGQLVAPGTPVLQVNGAGKGRWILNAAVSDAEWAAIGIGDQALVRTGTEPGRPLRATVSGKSEGVDPYSGTFLVRLQVEDSKAHKLAYGLFGNAEIEASGKISGWQLPYESLLDGHGSEAYVFVTSDKRNARRVKVEVDKVENGRVIIRSGLEEIPYLIVSGSAYLQDQSKIHVKN